MDHSTGLPRPPTRTSVLPRFSKLPQPNTPGPQTLVSPTEVHSTVNSADVQPKRLPQPRDSAIGFPGRTTVSPTKQSYGQTTAPPTSTASRQPLSHSQIKQGIARPRHAPSASASAIAAKSSRKVSQQENFLQDVDNTSSGESESDNHLVSRKPRPSLSDRTMESLSHVPPSPASARRRSSFFNPQSPMSPQRPPSQLGGSTPVSRLNYGARPATFARPSSPSKRPATSHVANTPARRTVSTELPKATSAALPTPKRTTSPPKLVRPPRPASSALPHRPTSTLPTSPQKTAPQSRISTIGSTARTLQQPATLARKGAPPNRLTRPTPAKPAAATATKQAGLTKAKEEPQPAPQVTEDASPSPASSSAALREQIAQAKAAARAAKQTLMESLETSPTEYDFEACEDPFNSKPKDGKDVLRSRIDDARRDGRLNIAAMGLTTIPFEVLDMFEPSSMEASSVPWNECVDLVRVNAADNALFDIADDVFPDVKIDALAQLEGARGNMFAGLESLDLHGNKLTHVPAGFRQLTRLTVLNLARNQLDNWAFDIITQMSSLRDLNLSHNNLSQELPNALTQLSQLETLDLSNNKLNLLPSSFRNLTRLRSIDLSKNRLASLPFDHFAQLPKLSTISASCNAITGALVPSSVSELTNLQILDVSDNAIASLTFSKQLHMPALIRIDVSRNRLGFFPDVSSWSNLTSLLAEENALSKFPGGVTALKDKLRVLNLERNSLRDIDEAVRDMNALETLALGGNPIRDRKLLSMDCAGIKAVMERRRDLSQIMSPTSPTAEPEP